MWKPDRGRAVLSSKTPSGVLSGVRVIEMEGMGPAPFACMLLADMGADVLTLAAPAKARRSAVAGATGPIRRGRARVELDLKSPELREDILALFAKADIVVEGFRPGAMERLGLGPDDLHRVNPALVLVRMTGWGQTGPLAQRPGHDPNYIAITGALHAIGPEAEPALPLNIVGDLAAGSLYAVIGAIAALRHAERMGEGQVIDAAIVDGAASLMTGFYGGFAAGTWQDRRASNLIDGGSYLTIYETKDGGHIALGSLEPQFYAALIEGMGLDIDSLPRRDDRANWGELRRIFAAVFKQRTRDEWVAALEQSDACLSGVLSLAEAPHHPHNAERGVFQQTESGLTPAPAPRFSGTPSQLAPSAGRDSGDMLRGWDIEDGTLKKLGALAA